MTEDEAKTKWCPFARCVVGVEIPGGAKTSGDTPTFNRIALPDGWTTPHGAKCGGSSCMAWRPTTTFRREDITSAQRPGPDWHMSVGTSNGWFRHVEESTGGYCGLAGQP